MENTNRRVAVVTGASSGIGRAITEMLISEDICVLANGRSVSSVFQESEMLKTFSADLLDDATPRKMLEQSIIVEDGTLCERCSDHLH